MMRGAFAHNHETWNKAIDLLAKNKIDLKPLISGDFALTEWEEGFWQCQECKGVKYLLYPVA